MTDTHWKHAVNSRNHWLKFITKQQSSIPLLKCWPKLTGRHSSWDHNKRSTSKQQLNYNASTLSILNWVHRFFQLFLRLSYDKCDNRTELVKKKWLIGSRETTSNWFIEFASEEIIFSLYVLSRTVEHEIEQPFSSLQLAGN